MLISEQWRQPEQMRASLRRPEEAVWTVPGLRNALILYDSEGKAAGLKQLAQEWTWDVQLEVDADRWVAEQVTGYCEDARRLMRHLETGAGFASAAMRSVLANRCAAIVAIHKRLLYPSENELWDLIAHMMGDEWSRLQSASMSLSGERQSQSAMAALELFALVIEDSLDLMDDRQRAVAESTLGLIKSF